MNTSTENEPAIAAIDEPRSRRQLLTAGGVAAIAGVLGAIGISTTAEAKNGQFLKAGSKVSASATTAVQSTKGPAFLARVTGKGSVAGLRGVAGSTKGVGVQGWSESNKGATIGVSGLTKSPDGKAGQFLATNGGTAVQARSPDKKGVALRTEGRLQFMKRSGVTPVTAGGSDIVTPVGGGLTESSKVLATLQDYRPGVHVEAAYVVPPVSEGLITIRLSQAVDEETRVAWLVLD